MAALGIAASITLSPTLNKLRHVKKRTNEDSTKLADPCRTPKDLLVDHYARILRVIGQDLANLLPVSLDIKAIGSVYMVHGQCKRERLEGKLNRTHKVAATIRGRRVQPGLQ